MSVPPPRGYGCDGAVILAPLLEGWPIIRSRAVARRPQPVDCLAERLAASPARPPGQTGSVARRPAAVDADRLAVRAAWTIAALAFLLFAFVAIRQHDTFHTRARDMGIYAQVIWNTSHGRPFASTLLEENRLHIAEHVAPVMALIAPLYALVPDPRLLLLLQQASLAAAGLPIFFWARRRVGDLAALGLLVGYELMPMTSRIAFSEFHPIVMAALPVALGVKAVLEGRARAAVVWLVLALLFEEETAPIVGAAGAYLWLRHRQWSGFGLGALAAAWLLVVTLVVMPAFHDRRTLAGVDGNRSLDHYEQVQERPTIALEWLAGPTWRPRRDLAAAPDARAAAAGAARPVARRAVVRAAVPGRPRGERGRALGRRGAAGLLVRGGGGARGAGAACWRSCASSAGWCGRAFVAVLAVVLAFCFWRVQLLPGRRRVRHGLARLDRARGEPGAGRGAGAARASRSTRRAGRCRTWPTGRRCTSSPRRSTRRRCGRTCAPSTCSCST